MKDWEIYWYAAWYPEVYDWYAVYTQYLGIRDGKPRYKTILMHRYLLDAIRGEYVDHKNHSGLDNTNDNIVKTTNRINTTNRRKANNGSFTGIRNVSYSKKDNKLQVQLQVAGKNKCFGRFKYPEELEKAAELAKRLRKEIYGLDE